jgi:hypothetical protein
LDLFLKDLKIDKEEIIATNNELNNKYIFRRNAIIVQDIHNQTFLTNTMLCKNLTSNQLIKVKKISDRVCEVKAEVLLFSSDYISQLSKNEINIIKERYYIYKKNKKYILFNIKKHVV